MTKYHRDREKLYVYRGQRVIYTGDSIGGDPILMNVDTKREFTVESWEIDFGSSLIGSVEIDPITDLNS